MQLNQHPEAFRQKVIVRLWLALGIQVHDLNDDVVEELLAEWGAALAELTLEQIDRGRRALANDRGTLPADQFAALCQRLSAPSPAPTGDKLSEVAQQELARMRELFGDAEAGS